jgi:arylsulfatase A-like enzyme
LAPYHPDSDAVRDDYLDYYAEITRLDRFVGDVVKELDRQGVAENTFVLFFSDNGRPFPRDKTTVYDSGIRTPFIIRFPKEVTANSICNTLVSSIDIAPTVLELAGCKVPASVEGKSFRQTLRDPKHVSRKYVFAEKNWHDFEDHVRAVRDTKFKYIRNYYEDLPNTPPADAVRSPTYETLKTLHSRSKLVGPQLACFTAPRPKEELYDTTADPHEINNLATKPEHHRRLLEMRAALKDWEKRTGDSPAELRTADEFDRVTGKPTAARRRPRWSKKKMVKEGLVAP